MTTVVLASASVIRADMLRRAGVSIEVRSSGVDETAIKSSLLAEGVSVRDIADALAEAKAVKASGRDERVVIGADTTLDLDGQLYDKPKDLKQLRAHLLTLEGRKHKLHTACVVALSRSPIWRHVATSTLEMRRFSPQFLDKYIEVEGSNLLSSVGGYRLEGLGAQLFSRIEGDYFSILGLPLLQLLDFLRLRGVVET